MKCSTGKRIFDTRELAEEALVENRSRFHHGDDSGPINVYLCEDCHQYHFTSKGPKSDLLEEEETKKRIGLSREAGYWERKLR